MLAEELAIDVDRGILVDGLEEQVEVLLGEVCWHLETLPVPAHAGGAGEALALPAASQIGALGCPRRVVEARAEPLLPVADALRVERQAPGRRQAQDGDLSRLPALPGMGVAVQYASGGAQPGVEVGRAFGQVGDLLPARDRLKARQAGADVGRVPAVRGPEQALGVLAKARVGERQRGQLDAAQQLRRAVFGQLLGAGEEGVGLVEERWAEDAGRGGIADAAAGRFQGARVVVLPELPEQHLILPDRLGGRAEVAEDDVAQQRLRLEARVPELLAPGPGAQRAISGAGALVVALQHDALGMVLEVEADGGRDDLPVRHGHQVMAEVDRVVPDVDLGADGGPAPHGGLETRGLGDQQEGLRPGMAVGGQVNDDIRARAQGARRLEGIEIGQGGDGHPRELRGDGRGDGVDEVQQGSRGRALGVEDRLAAGALAVAAAVVRSDAGVTRVRHPAQRLLDPVHADRQHLGVRQAELAIEVDALAILLREVLRVLGEVALNRDQQGETVIVPDVLGEAAPLGRHRRRGRRGAVAQGPLAVEAVPVERVADAQAGGELARHGADRQRWPRGDGGALATGVPAAAQVFLQEGEDGVDGAAAATAPEEQVAADDGDGIALLAEPGTGLGGTGLQQALRLADAQAGGRCRRPPLAHHREGRARGLAKPLPQLKGRLLVLRCGRRRHQDDVLGPPGRRQDQLGPRRALWGQGVAPRRVYRDAATRRERGRAPQGKAEKRREQGHRESHRVHTPIEPVPRSMLPGGCRRTASARSVAVSGGVVHVREAQGMAVP